MQSNINISSFTDLRHFIRVYDADLDAGVCEQLIGMFTASQRLQRPNGRGLRAGLEHSAWVELNLSRIAGDAMNADFAQRQQRALQRYNADTALAIALPGTQLTSDLVMKRYRPTGDERFQLHFDAINHVANRYLVMLWYLNDVSEGGETRFPQLDMSVSARRGRLLMFPPYWMYQHEGLPPQSGEKFILSTYLLFGDVPTR